MKTLQIILYVLVAFFGVVGVGYTVWTSVFYGGPEWVGILTILLMAVFSLFIGFYLGVEKKPFINRPLPEDRLDAEIADADEELGQFSPWSWWPVLLAGTIGFTLVGVSVGWWPVFFIAPIVLWAIIGWAMEYYRHHLKH